MKIKEPTATYYSQPAIHALKNKIMESVRQENDVDKLQQCLRILSSVSSSHNTSDYFEQLKTQYACLKGTPMPCQYKENELIDVIKESEKSGVAEAEEVEALFARWKR